MSYVAYRPPFLHYHVLHAKQSRRKLVPGFFLLLTINVHSRLQMTRAMTAQGEKESHWMRLIDLEGDMNFTLQNKSAVKGQKLGLCL